MDEILKEIDGYKGYAVSNYGNVYSKRFPGFTKKLRDHYKKLSPSKRHKYLGVVLCNEKGKSMKSIHRIVAEHFIPNPDKKPCVNHIDGNQKNNNVLNLEWITWADNEKHAVINGLKAKGERGGSAKLTADIVLEIRKRYECEKISYGSLAKIYKVGKSSIARYIHGNSWKHLFSK